MKKIAFTTLLFVSVFAYAQPQFGPVKDKYRKLYYLEFTGGTNYSLMDLQQKSLLTNKAHSSFTPLVGMAFRVQFNKHLSFAPQLAYHQFSSNFVVRDTTRFNMNTLTFFAPLDVEFALKQFNTISTSFLFVFGGPYVAYTAFADVNKADYREVLENDNLGRYDYGMEGGLGLRVPHFFRDGRMNIALKTSYYYGLNDLFAKQQPIVAPFNDLSGYSLKNSGLRIAVTLEVCLSKWFITSYTAGGNGRNTYERLVIIKNRNKPKRTNDDPFGPR
jgi:hypothetical protein